MQLSLPAQENNLITIPISIFSQTLYFILDCGSVISLISSRYVHPNQLQKLSLPISISGINGSQLQITTHIFTSIQIGTCKFRCRFYVIPESIPIPGLIGLDILQFHKLSLDFNNCTLQISGHVPIPFSQKYFCLFTFPNYFLPTFQPELTIPCAFTVQFPPQSYQIALIENILADHDKELIPIINQKYIQIVHLVPHSQFIYCICFNPSQEYRTLYKNQKIFKVEASVPTTDTLSQVEKEQSFTTLILTKENIEQSLDSSIQGEIRTKFKELLQKFKHVFHSPGEKLIPSTYVAPRLRLKPGITPIKLKPYKLSEVERQAVEKVIQDHVEQGILVPSISPWSFPITAVPKGHRKADGTFAMRVCADLRSLNRCLEPQNYPIPNISLLINQLKNYKYFSVLDMSKSYYQVNVHPDDQQLLTIITEKESLSFARLPMGLSQSPIFFQAFVNEVFGPILFKHAIIYLDDICVYSKTYEEHITALDEVFRLAAKHRLHFNATKCLFARTSVKLLGFIVDGTTVKMNPDKIKAITELKPPKTVRDLQLFMGKVNYLRSFIPNLAQVATPLTELVHKDSTLTWNSECDEAFNKIKSMLTSYPILYHYQPHLPLYLYTDASEHSIGSVLLQPDPGHPEKVRIIEYYSKKLAPTQVRWATVLKEFYAVYQSVKHFHCYCFGKQTFVYTDHKSIIGRNFATNVRTNKQLLRYALELAPYRLSFHYVKSKDNVIADFLSRYNVGTDEYIDYLNKYTKTQPPSTPHTVPTDQNEAIDMRENATNYSVLLSDLSNELSLTTNFITTTMADAQHLDSYCKKLINELTTGQLRDNFQLINKQLYNTKLGYPRLVVPRILVKDILQAYHSSIVGGHRYFLATYKRIFADYYWPSMKKDIFMYIKSCAVCQHAKRPVRPPQGTLGSVPYIDIPFHSVSIDFVGPIHVPAKGMQRNILVCVCLFSKYVEIKGTHTQTADEVSTFLIERIFTKHGPPQTILSDRGTCFRSQVVQNLLKALEVKPYFTTAYKPQHNGSCERTNQSIVNILKTLLNENTVENWYELLPFVQYIYNTTPSRPSGMSPFEIVYGRKPPPIFNFYKDNPLSQYRFEQLKAIPLIRSITKQRLEKERAYNKQRYDIGKQDKLYNEGDLVLIFKPAILPTQSKKFVKKWVGPGIVQRQISRWNYEIYFPSNDTTQIIHISRLKLFNPPSNEEENESDEEIYTEYSESELLQIYRDFIKHNLVQDNFKALLEVNKISFQDNLSEQPVVFTKALHYNLKWKENLFSLNEKRMLESTVHMVIQPNLTQHECWQHYEKLSDDPTMVTNKGPHIMIKILNKEDNKLIVLINKVESKSSFHLLICKFIQWYFENQKIKTRHVTITSSHEDFLLVSMVIIGITETLHSNRTFLPLDMIKLLRQSRIAFTSLYFPVILPVLYIIYKYMETSSVIETTSDSRPDKLHFNYITDAYPTEDQPEYVKVAPSLPYSLPIPTENGHENESLHSLRAPVVPEAETQPVVSPELSLPPNPPTTPVHIGSNPVRDQIQLETSNLENIYITRRGRASRPPHRLNYSHF